MFLTPPLTATAPQSESSALNVVGGMTIIDIDLDIRSAAWIWKQSTTLAFPVSSLSGKLEILVLTGGRITHGV